MRGSSKPTSRWQPPEHLYLIHVHLQAGQDLVEMVLLNRHLSRLTKCHVTQQHTGAKCQGVHVLSGRGKNFAALYQLCTLGFGFTGRLVEAEIRRMSRSLKTKDQP